MKSRLKKSLFFVILTLATFILMNTVAIAADSDAGTIRIKLEDKVLSVEGIRLMEDGRTYAPYDSLLKAMGAVASYDEETGTVTGTLGDTTVIFTLDYCYAEINDVSYFIYAIPFQDSDTGVVYIPVRYTAQALGYIVGWDEATSSISLQSVKDFIADSGASYSVINKYLDYQKSTVGKNYELTGSFNMSLELASVEDSAPLSVAGDVSGLIGGGNAEMKVSMKTSLSDFISTYMSKDELDKQTLAMLTLLNNIDLDLILNSDEGMMYLSSPLLVLLGLDDSTWLSMDLSDYMSDVGELDMVSADSFEDILVNILKQYNISDTGGITAQLFQSINSMYCDQAMTKVGDNYVSTISYEEDGIDLVARIVFSFDGKTFKGISAEVYIDIDETMSIDASFSSGVDGKSSMEMSYNAKDSMKMEMSAEFTLTETKKTPSSAPEDDSTIIPVEDLMSELMELTA